MHIDDVMLHARKAERNDGAELNVKKKEKKSTIAKEFLPVFFFFLPSNRIFPHFSRLSFLQFELKLRRREKVRRTITLKISSLFFY